MSAQFVARALSYCLGKGTIALKGRNKRPWLELQRTELEGDYLRHQIRILQRLHQGRLEIVWDQVERDSFYCDIRARFHTDALWAAYELMYPRDEKVITRQIIDIAGMIGVAALTCDTASCTGKRFYLRLPHGDIEDLRGYLVEAGYPVSVFRNAAGSVMAYVRERPGLGLAKDLRKIIHSSMRHKVDAYIEKYEPKKTLRRPREFKELE